MIMYIYMFTFNNNIKDGKDGLFQKIRLGLALDGILTVQFFSMCRYRDRMKESLICYR